MIHQQLDLIDPSIDFESLPAEIITLDDTQINAALEISNKIHSPKRKWSTYLNALGMKAFEQWLKERAPDIPANFQQNSLFHPAYAQIIDAVCHIEVNHFKLCLIVIGTASDDLVVVPRAVIDLPDFTAQFYVIVEVIEELEQAIISSFLRYDTLIGCQREANLIPQPDWTYNIPINWFDTNIDDLLLYLRCLEPNAIPLPETRNTRASNSSIQLLPSQNNDYEVELWQKLTWEQGAALLTNLVRKSIVNVSLWLRDEMDELARGLTWVLLPILSPQAVPLRSPEQEIEAIITQLGRTGQHIPASARGAYQDFPLAQAKLRLYAVTWALTQEKIPEWGLLLVLGASPGYNLPHNTKMIVSDDTRILVERVLDRNTPDTYIYARVAGTWDETFRVTIALSNGASLTLPQFAFYPEESK